MSAPGTIRSTAPMPNSAASAAESGLVTARVRPSASTLGSNTEFAFKPYCTSNAAPSGPLSTP
jgi:hypothetical protein